MGEGRQEEVLILIGFSSAVAFIFVAARVYSRYLGRSFGWDDYLIIVASVLLLGEITAVWKYILLNGTGYHIANLPEKSVVERVTAMKWHFAILILYHPLMGSIRASIIMFLFRMHDRRRRIRYSLHVVFWINVFYTIGTTFGSIFQCNPVRYSWEKAATHYQGADSKAIKGGTCLGIGATIVSCAFNILMDLIIIPIPSIMAWTLKMTLRTKLLVILVISLTSIAISASVGRLVVYYCRLTSPTTDLTWNIGIAILIAEPCVHIMAACAPATTGLFRSPFTSTTVERTSICYEAEKPAPTIKTSKLGSKTSNGTLNFHFGRSEKDVKDNFTLKLEAETGKVDTREGKRDEDLQPLATRSTRAYIGGHTGAPRKKKTTSMEAPKSSRTSCSRTVYTDMSEIDEDEFQVEPEHIPAHGLYS